MGKKKPIDYSKYTVRLLADGELIGTFKNRRPECVPPIILVFDDGAARVFEFARKTRTDLTYEEVKTTTIISDHEIKDFKSKFRWPT